MKKIREIIANYKDRKRNEDIDDLKSEFKVVERDGVLYFTHLGVAFAKIAPTAHSEDIATALNHARNIAVEFEAL